MGRLAKATTQDAVFLSLVVAVAACGPAPPGTPTWTAQPTYTPYPTHTPYPTNTPLPSATREPTNSPTAAEQPQPTDTVQPTETPAPPPRQVARVLRIIHGDTIEVEIGGQTYALRYIGIDSPELRHPESSVQSRARDAAAANEALVGGKTVELGKDVSETDRYGRLLRYVWIGDVMVNAELVRQGHAEAVSYPPDVRYDGLFVEMEQEAREAGRGLWGPGPGVGVVGTRVLVATATAAPQSRAAPPTAPAAPAGAVIRITQVDKRAEFVDVRNDGDQPQDLSGWVLVSERGEQSCALGGVIGPGETLRIWAMAEDQAKGGYNCGFGANIWNNSKSDPAVLYDAAQSEVDRYP